MRKSIEAIKGDKLQNIRNNQIYTVADVCGESLVLTDENGVSKINKLATIKRWFKMYEEYVAPVVEEKIDEYRTRNDRRALPPQRGIEVNKDDVNTVITNNGCFPSQKKEYLGVYKEGQRGAICMIRFSKKGNMHIDMKPSVYEKLDSNYKYTLETRYDTGIYDKTRGYFRISGVNDLEVLQNVIIAGTI